MKGTTMKRTNLIRPQAVGLAALALTLSIGLSACGSEDDDNADTATEPTTSSTPMAEDTEPTEEPMDEPTDGAAAGTFGPGCELVPADGAGSFEGMATEPVATAASANPLLGTLVAAVTAAELGDTLNSAEALTVFAPTDDAFAAIKPKDLEALLADKDALTQVLTHHVVAGQLAPEEVAGMHETLNGDMIEVMGSGTEFTVGDENAAVLCGNIPTANATVYVIDSVLMP